MLKDRDPYTDQEPFPEEMEALVAEYDKSEGYEIDVGAIFKTATGLYRGVIVSGCS